MYTIVDLCILCLTNDTNLINILSPDNDGVLIEEKLHFFLFELDTIEPNTSKHICLHCLENLNNVYNYKQLCLQNIVKFNSYMQTVKNTKESCSNLQVSLIDIIKFKEKLVKVGNKSSCEFIKTEKLNLYNVGPRDPSETEIGIEYVLDSNYILRKEIISGDNNFVKQELGDIIDNVADTEVPDENVIAEVDEPLTEDDKLKYNSVDGIMKQELEDIYEYNEIYFIKSEFDNDSTDKFLNETFYNSEYFLSTLNISQKDNEEKAHEFNKLNGEGLRQSINLTNHKRSGEKSYNCDVCCKAFKHALTLTRHICIHTDQKPYRCNVCGKAFNFKQSLSSHRCIHDTEKQFKCDVCDKVFSKMFILIDHKRTHTGEKPYKCDMCNKAFCIFINLKRHQRIHTGEKPYKCDVCNKTFNVSNNLKRHRRIHSGDKPHKCDVCDKAFIAAHTLARHKRIHSGEKPYKCDMCDKTCNVASNLKKHQRVHQKGTMAV